MNKICPFIPPDEEGTRSDITRRPVPCLREKCELWTDMFTTENNRIQGCALRFIAMKNSEGNITV